jgi:hypothetical protein
MSTLLIIMFMFMFIPSLPLSYNSAMFIPCSLATDRVTCTFVGIGSFCFLAQSTLVNNPSFVAVGLLIILLSLLLHPWCVVLQLVMSHGVVFYMSMHKIEIGYEPNCMHKK